MDDELEDKVFYQTYVSNMKLMSKFAVGLSSLNSPMAYVWKLFRYYLLRPEVVFCGVVIFIFLIYLQAVDVWSRGLIGRIQQTLGYTRSRAGKLKLLDLAANDHQSWEITKDSSAAFAVLGRRPRMEDRRRCSDNTLRRERHGLRVKSKSVLELSDNVFRRNFRLGKRAFLYVLKELETDFPVPTKSGVLSPTVKLAICLKFLAEGSYQQAVGKDFHFNIAQSTVSKVVKEVLNSLETKLCPKWIKFEMNNEEKSAAKQYFFNKSNIPGITMCLDGTHVKILRPRDRQHSFFNRKHFYSLNVLIMCDHESRIRFVDARFPGSCHDSHIWNLSDAKKFIERSYSNADRSIRLLGDSGYPLQPWLLTPFRNVGDDSKKTAYNTKHAAARNIIERTIGYLKNRFRCLMDERALYYSDKKSAQCLLCTT